MICKRNFSAGLGHGNSNCEHNPHHPWSREHRQVGSLQLTGLFMSVTTFFTIGVQFISFHINAGYRSQFSSVGCTKVLSLDYQPLKRKCRCKRGQSPKTWFVHCRCSCTFAIFNRLALVLVYSSISSCTCISLASAGVKKL